MRRGEILGRRGGIGARNLKQQLLFKGLLSWRLGIAVIVLLICIFSLYSLSGFASPSYTVQNVDVNTLWRSADSGGWRASSAPRTNWPPPPVETNGYLRVRCNGGLNQQRSAICNAVVAARIMNATLILPDLDTNSFWRDESGFPGIYDVEHFIKTLRFDVRIVKSIPDITSNGKLKKMKPHQIRPPRDAPLSWYTTFALEKMKKHGAIYLTPFSHRLAEDIDEPELQRLRCRVNYHALRFKPHIMKISSEIVNKLRQEGRFMSIHLRFEMDMLAFAGFKLHIMRISSEIVNKLRQEGRFMLIHLRLEMDMLAFAGFKPHIMKISSEIVNKWSQEGRFMSIHLRFEMDMLAFAGCFDIFTPAEQKILKKYRNANFAPKDLVYRERRLIGKCPLTPEEVGLLLRSMGFSNSTRIYLASGALFGGNRFMSPFRSLFPLLSNHSSIAPSLLSDSDRGLAGSAVDYMVCLLSDIFIPTYDGPSNFANNLMGHRLYYGFRTTITPDRKGLAPVFMEREEGKVEEEGFEERVRRVMFASGKFGGVHERGKSESFYTNSWPECFCKVGAREKKDECPSGNVVEGLERRWREEGEGEERGSGSEESVG